MHIPNTGGYKAVLWQAGSTTAIELSALGGYLISVGGVNDSGQVVGSSDTFSIRDDIKDREQVVGCTADIFHAALWQAGLTVAIDLGGNAAATGINNVGQVVGWDHSRDYRAKLWGSGSMTPINLGMLPGGNYSFAYSINDIGQAVGYSDTKDNSSHAVLWQTGSSKPVDLGTLGGKNSYAYAINYSSQVVGHSETISGEEHAALWETGIPTDLGTLRGGFTAAYGINASGQIVGESEISGANSHAVLWQAGSATPIDLNTLVDLPNSVYLQSARGINDHGQIIANGSDGIAVVLNPSP